MMLKCIICGDLFTEDDLLLTKEGHVCLFCGKNFRKLEINRCYNLDCGEGIKRILSGTVDLILTDPPYDVNFNEKQKDLLNFRKLSADKQNSYKSYAEFGIDYNSLSRHFYRVLRQDSHAYIFCGHNQLSRWISSMEKAGFKFCQLLIWQSNIPKFDLTLGHKFMENKEQILYFQKGWRRLEYERIPKHQFRTCFKFDSIKTKENEWHLCLKPYDLLKMLILVSSNENDLMLDCFAGSGEHLITAMKLNRNFIGFEISKEFNEKIERRIDYHRSQMKLNAY